MSRSPKIKVDPKLLVWARESVGVETTDVAKRLGVKVEVVDKWEAGDELITYRRLEGLADYYKRPVAAFFLPKVPADSLTPTDFRSSQGERIVMSKDLRLAVRRARFLRNIFSEINPDYKRVVSHTVKLSDSPEKVAQYQREKLGLTFELQKGWSVGREALAHFIKLLENQGVLVLQQSFPETEISGFSLGDDDKPPVIVLNSKDGLSRRTFTLFHEYCHLLLNKSGICKLTNDVSEFERDDAVEGFCDKFASEFLVPNEIFLSHRDIFNVKRRDDDENAIRRMANAFKVSRQVILVRLLLTKNISSDYYQEKKEKFNKEYYDSLKKIKQKQKESPGGPPPYIMAVAHNGRLFSKTVVQAYRSGKISNKEVSSYLGVKLNHVANVESLL